MNRGILSLFQLFENHSESEVIADANFAKYANLGRALENYFAITHPSQPNYFSLVGELIRNLLYRVLRECIVPID